MQHSIAGRKGHRGRLIERRPRQLRVNIEFAADVAAAASTAAGAELASLLGREDLRPSDFIPFDRVQGEVGSVDAPSASWAWPMLADMLPLP
jgi:hypothetical protein